MESGAVKPEGSADSDARHSAPAPSVASAPAELHSPYLMRDPYPVYRTLLAEPTMTRSPLGFWVAARHRDVAQVLRDKRFGHDYARDLVARHGPDIFEQAGPRAVRHWFMLQNPPVHTRMRALFSSTFNPQRIRAMGPHVERIANGLIDGVIARGSMDAFREYASVLSSNVISEILGVPVEHQAQFLTRIPARVLDMIPLSREESERINRDVEFITAYFDQLCEQRRAEPRDDLVSALVQGQGQHQDGGLSNEELLANIFLLFAAGYDTTANLIGNALVALHRHPDQLALLKADPTRIPGAVDELMRYDSSVQMTIRHALADVEMAGVVIRAGDPVMVVIGAANRDPEVYPNPDVLDVTRTDLRVLGFGAGLHYCLGAELARRECAVALATIFTRLPKLELDLDNIEWRKTLTFRGVRHLWARW